MKGVKVDGRHLLQNVSQHLEPHLGVLRDDRLVELVVEVEREQRLVKLPEEELQAAGDLCRAGAANGSVRPWDDGAAWKGAGKTR